MLRFVLFIFFLLCVCWNFWPCRIIPFISFVKILGYCLFKYLFFLFSSPFLVFQVHVCLTFWYCPTDRSCWRILGGKITVANFNSCCAGLIFPWLVSCHFSKSGVYNSSSNSSKSSPVERFSLIRTTSMAPFFCPFPSLSFSKSLFSPFPALPPEALLHLFPSSSEV